MVWSYKGYRDPRVWGDGIRRCSMCGEWKDHPEEYYANQRRCKPCRDAMNREAILTSSKATAHSGAYGMVIKDRYSGELRKCSGELPDGWELVYRCPIGYVLPRKFWRLEEYFG